MAAALHAAPTQKSDTLVSVVVLEDGTVRMQETGQYQYEDECNVRMVVYQKDLLPAKQLTRSHHSLLSTYKIKSGEKMANVPWASFEWVKSKRASDLLRVSACTDCSRDDCAKCFEKLTAEDIMVVCIHGSSGSKIYQWYVAFKNKDNVLTRVPSQFCAGIVQRSSIAGFCQCGRCKHPLYAMLSTRSRSRADEFDRRAVAVFTELRNLVNATKTAKNNQARRVPCASQSVSNQASFVEDTCAVCLEETFVNGDCCVHKRCSVKLCAECHAKTRGLCPLCDRSKLSKAVAFMCHACNEGVPLDEFGHGCLSCNESKLCKQCFKNFGICSPCENDIMRDTNRKRKHNDSV